jgi:tRNA dimethylallyltransferase
VTEFANNADRQPLTVVVGPTASGKTALAARLAESVGGEVVSADSVQVYRRFDIGAGKPTADERSRAPHHLIDAADPLEPMDAARWASLAERAIADIRARGRVPVVCGGTFLWVRALVLGLAPAPPADSVVRARHKEVVSAEGRGALHTALAAVDAVSANRLSPNDFVRVSRALEVFELTGRPMSAWHSEHGFRETRHVARFVGLRHTPDELSARIAARTDTMLAAGWIDEVRALLDAGFGEARAMKSVGYRQVAEALSGEAPLGDALRDSIVRATRIFARRQRTWLREELVEWLSPEEAERATLNA